MIKQNRKIFQFLKHLEEDIKKIIVDLDLLISRISM